MIGRPAALAALLLLALAPAAEAQMRLLVPDDIQVPSGFRIDVAARDLDAPTMVAFDGQGRMVVAESGYGGAGEAKVTRIEPDGKRTVLATGFQVPLTAVAYADGTLYAVDATTIYRIREGAPPEPVVTGLPGAGDHQANQVVVHNGTLYVGVGTVTNSGVVGYDNWVFGWLREPSRQGLHEVPCKDIRLRGQSFASDDPIHGGTTNTSAYAPFGTTHPAGHIVAGNVRCNGSILSARLVDLPGNVPPGVGSAVGQTVGNLTLKVHAWGLRNPYGLEVGPDGALWATMHGFDARGSRPIEDAWDCLYRIEEGAWYGFPDFACDVPVTDPRFRTPDKPAPEFLLAEHPDPKPPVPAARFDAHAAANGFAFSPGGDWGNRTDAFVALFGDMAPATGTVDEPKGFKIVRVDTTTGDVVDFITNKVSGRASRYVGGGFEHPSDVTFGPDGAMYITDWGVADITGEGIRIWPSSGVVWKLTRTDGPAGHSVPPPQAGLTQAGAIAPTTFAYGVIALLLVSVAAGLVWGPGQPTHLGRSAIAGLAGGLVLGLAAILVGMLVFSFPWWVPPRILATMAMGRRAEANILEFEPVSTVTGFVVLLAIMTLFGLLFGLLARQVRPARRFAGAILWALGGWALFQFVLWPLFFPLVSDKAFPPIWFAAAFLLYGVTLGLLLLRRDTWPWVRRAPA